MGEGLKGDDADLHLETIHGPLEDQWVPIHTPSRPSQRLPRVSQNRRSILGNSQETRGHRGPYTVSQSVVFFTIVYYIFTVFYYFFTRIHKNSPRRSVSYCFPGFLRSVLLIKARIERIATNKQSPVVIEASSNKQSTVANSSCCRIKLSKEQADRRPETRRTA